MGVTLKNKDASNTKRRRKKKSGVLLYERIFPGKESYVDEADVFYSSNVLLCMHSSEIRGLRSTKCSSETLQNLLYFMYIDQGIYKVKI